jgi:hypothetical protein
MIEKIKNKLQTIKDISTDRRLINNLITVLFGWTLKFVDTYQYNKILNQAQLTTNKTEDSTARQYITKSSFFATIAGIINLIIATITLPRLFSFFNITIDISLPPTLLQFIPLSIALFFQSNQELILKLLAYAIIMIVSWFGVFLTRYFFPIYIKKTREERIDQVLAESFTYIAAVTQGDANLTNVFIRLAEREELYDEVSKEVRQIINRKRLGNDIKRSLQEQVRTTPSNELSVYFEDLFNTVQQGGRIDDFAYRKAKKQIDSLERAIKARNQRQIDFSQIVLILLVLPPVSLIGGITISMLGSPNMALFYLIPVTMAFIMFIVGAIFVVLFTNSTPPVGDFTSDVPPQLKFTTNNQNLTNYLIQNPYYAFVASIPISVSYAVLYVLSSSAPNFVSNPAITLLVIFMIPYILLTVPYIILYEFKQFRNRKAKRDLLRVFQGALQSAQQGNIIRRAFLKQAESLDSHFSNVLYREVIAADSIKPIQLKFALERTAEKYDSSVIKRNIGLFADSLDEVSDSTVVLEVLTEILQIRQRLEKERKTNSLQPAFIFIIASLLTSAIFLILDVTFIAQFDSVAQQLSNSQAPGAISGFKRLNFDVISASTYYTSIIATYFSGLIAGRLTGKSFKSGLKYSIILPLIVTIAFILF